ncbi:AMP-binding protein [Methylobacterium aerolatum]|uniref:Malonyl-CoA/methylmalonyl-CoA synthetase n=1 Tax=Methylobacterium aerolatum TaxID=418708 RepID=A0ABU0I679_9HYPH|nr:AMP-binding protein [Methylobacterium aerolatum]MDQ0449592.1 malonyl-CoA/methylmalonyl-CoA synthetase [Methylobacterium aerolatum]GJD36119.1 Long-chain-fatty-acid--CoA ligase [Methylobacterium aerolatum]
MSDNLYDRLCPGSTPEAPVFRAEDGTRWTRADVADLAGRFAAFLGQAGAGAGDRVAVQVEKSPEAVCLYLACLKAGAVYVPLNTAYTGAEVRRILDDARPRLFVGGAAMIAALGAEGLPPDCAALPLDARAEGSVLAAARAMPPLAETVPLGGDDPAAILYTSGTTGRPKGAVLSHANLLFSADSLVPLWGMRADDVLLHALPVFHAHGLFIAINTALRVGASTLFLERFTPDAVIRTLPDATVFMGVPTFYGRLLADPRLDAGLCAGMRLFTCGSAPLSAAVHEAFRARTGHTILERYGLTETTIVASNPLDGLRAPGTVGYALPGVDVAVRDRDGRPLPAGTVGELVLRGPNVFQRYWNLPEATAAATTGDGFFRTGDLATIAPDGRIAIVGRAKDMIISGGYNVYPQEVETALSRIEGIRDSAVIGVPHPDFGEGVVAVIEPEEGRAPPAADVIVARLAGELARYKLPKVVVSMPSLPRNALGKVQKNDLREIHRAAFGGEAG